MGSDWKTPRLVYGTVRGEGRGYDKRVTYNLVSTKARMVWNLSLNILAPDDGMFLVRCEEFCDILGLGLNVVKPLLPEHTREVMLNSCDGSGRNVVAEDPKCRDGLVVMLVSERVLGLNHLLGDERHHYVGY